ncbi:hypothetical protein LEP1GSC124_0290, partial [Leptospira interrogans serovar Pyrogenes str. 200701872]
MGTLSFLSILNFPRETVAGHRKLLNHARNLTVVDLESGNPR